MPAKRDDDGVWRTLCGGIDGPSSVGTRCAGDTLLFKMPDLVVAIIHRRHGSNAWGPRLGGCCRSHDGRTWWHSWRRRKWSTSRRQKALLRCTAAKQTCTGRAWEGC